MFQIALSTLIAKTDIQFVLMKLRKIEVQSFGGNLKFRFVVAKFEILGIQCDLSNHVRLTVPDQEYHRCRASLSRFYLSSSRYAATIAWGG